MRYFQWHRHEDDVDTGIVKAWCLSVALVLQTALCQGGDQSDEQKFYFERNKKHDKWGGGGGGGGGSEETQAHY